MTVSERRCKFIEAVPRTDVVTSFRFEVFPPFEFIPGQFVQVIFDEDSRPNKELNKYLSFSCAPHKDFFEVTKKISDSLFSQRLKALTPGDTVLFKGPMGKCVLTDQDERIAFIVGGIGITPVISMLEHIQQKKSAVDVNLIYSNWTEKDIAFKVELDQWQKANPQIKVRHAIVSEKPADPNMHHGLIDEEFLSKIKDDLASRKTFILGPPGMVKSMMDICVQIGLPKDNIVEEKFLGYD